MSFSPRGLGDPRPLLCTFNTDSAAFPESFAASDLSIFFVDTTNKQKTQGVGTWANISGNYGEYTPANTDAIFTTAGIYSCYVVIKGVPFDNQVIEVRDPSKPS